MMDYGIFVEGLDIIEDIEGLDPNIMQAAYRAINASADRGRTDSDDLIRRQVNFPKSYLNPSQGRLTVSKRASAASLEAVITGRRRATSLARFLTKGEPGKKGVSVSVKPGRNVDLPNAFLMKLRSGSGNIDTVKNLGLAVRTKRGTRPDKAYKPVRVADGLWLLYGPSVDQVFKTVRQDVTPEVERTLEAEFTRLLEVKL
ncbi:hypothetical protein WKW50_16545 [Ochrobactrum sp. GPK 3]